MVEPAAVLVVAVALAAGAAAALARRSSGPPGDGPRGWLGDASDRVVGGSARLARPVAVVALVAYVALTGVVELPQRPAGSVSGDLQDLVTLGVFALGLASVAAAWRWPASGAAGLAVAAAAMGALVTVQYEAPLGAVTAGVLFVPAALLWLGWQRGRSAGPVLGVAGVAVTLAAGTWLGGVAVYDHFYGPTHPESATTLARSPVLDWIWSGGVTPTSARVNLKTARPTDELGEEVSVVVSRRGDLSDPVRSVPLATTDADHRLASVELEGLQPDTRYHYGVVVDTRPDGSRIGTFRTPARGPTSFTVAFSACARTGSNGAVFDAIAEQDPSLYLITGDLHYGNVDRDDPGRMREVLDATLSAPAQQSLYLQTPIAYVWDDHDYGGNNSDAASPARGAAQQVYRSHVPHHPLVSGAGIHQSFTIGRVRFVLTDTRSHRVPDDDGRATMLGERQLDWFEAQLSLARRRGELVVWVNPTPWIGQADPDADTWAGFDQERRRVAEAIEEHRRGALVMVSGDAHMVAIDDGSNSAYAPGASAAFPVAHAAALDRNGSVKGGPYSEGTFPGGGQFGLLEVRDDGGERIEVALSGHRWDGRELVRHELTLSVEDPGAPRR